MMNLQSEINSKFEKIKHNFPDLKTFENLEIKIMGKVVSLENFRDKNRDKKLAKLLNSDQNKFPENTVEINNLTPYEIPKNIQEFLKHGRNAAIGGFQSEDQIFLEINDLFEKYQARAKADNISDKEIQEIKCHSFITFQNIKNSFTVDP